MSTVEQLLEELKSGSISVTSEFRDEKKQSRNVQRISRLKNETKKQSRLAILTELALPFDPRDGSDKVFNNSNKFRPELSCENAIRLYQALAKEVPATKEMLCRRSGLEPDEWVIGDPNEINEMSMRIFKKFRTPIVYSVYAFRCSMRNVTGQQFAKNYSVDVKIDPTTGETIGYTNENGEFIHGEPLVAKLAKLLNDLGYEEKRDMEEKVRNKQVQMNEEQLNAFKSQVNTKRSSITSIAPVNYMLCLELPLDDLGNLDKNLANEEWDAKTLLSYMRYVKLNQSVSNGLDKVRSKRYEKFDTAPNFMVMDLNCGNEKDSLKLYQSTTYDVLQSEFKNEDMFPKINNALNEVYVPETHLEKIAIASTYMSKYSSDLETIMVEALSHPNYLKPDDEFLTKRVVERNEEVLGMIFPEEINEIFIRNDMDMNVEGNLDEEQSLKDGAELAKEAVMEEDFDEDFDDIEDDVELDI